MPKENTTHLFDLIKSMSAAEKTYFKSIYDSKSSKEYNLIKLFDAITKQQDYNEQSIVKELNIPPKRISDIKNHLYETLLDKLSNFHSRKNILGEVRQQLDYRDLLVQKGLYEQSSKIDVRIEKLIDENKEELMHYHIDVIPGIIDSQISQGNWKWLKTNSSLKIKQLEKSIKSSSVKQEFYSLYLKAEECLSLYYTKRENELFTSLLTQLNKENLLKDESIAKEFACELLFNKTNSIVCYLNNDIKSAIKFRLKVKFYFEIIPIRIRSGFEYYVQSLDAILYLSLTNSKYHQIAHRLVRDLKQIKPKYLPDNYTLEVIMHLYRLQISIHSKNLAEIQSSIKEAEDTLKNKLIVESRHMLMMKFLIALGYYHLGNFKSSTKLISSVLNSDTKSNAEDILYFTKLLSLFVHFELGNDTLIEANALSLKRTYTSEFKNNLADAEVLKFVNKYFIYQQNQKEFVTGLKSFNTTNENLKNAPPNSFVRYFDILFWIETKMNLHR